METTLYSIGHGRKSVEEFVNELRSFDIELLIDVRSMPFSKWAPDFNQSAIELWLPTKYGIMYSYMGDCIGGRPLDDSCYDAEGYFDYERMAETREFQRGLEKLIIAHENQKRVAVMCSEADPAQCHRSKLIGRELYAQEKINMRHIIGKDKYVLETEVIADLDKGEGNWRAEQLDLFNDNEPPHFKSRKAYKTTSDTPEEEYDDI